MTSSRRGMSGSTAGAPRAGALVSVVAVVFAIGLPLGCGANRGSEPSVESRTSALTADQCSYFQIGGKTRICHATGSAKNPYVILDLAEAACVSSHAAHPADFVAVENSSCNGQGCLPQGAPSDPTLACCEGLAPSNGTCQPTNPCLGVTCTASDQCHVSACDSATGKCDETPKVDAFPCNDGNACTTGDVCAGGTCSGAAVTCTAADQCHVAGTCDTATGTCSSPAAPDGTTCNNGGANTQTDVCSGGTCVVCNPDAAPTITCSNIPSNAISSAPPCTVVYLGCGTVLTECVYAAGPFSGLPYGYVPPAAGDTYVCTVTVQEGASSGPSATATFSIYYSP